MSVASEHWSIKNLPSMDDEEFELWRTLLESRTGMTIANERKTFLETSLAMRMREIGLEDYNDYYEKLMSNTAAKSAIEWSTLVDRLTVQETSFFRHRSSYELVENFIENKIRKKQKSLEIWSVGCSTGEEPYSLAMLVSELIKRKHSKMKYGITATDISLPALSKAKAGIYHNRKLQLLDPKLAASYFSEYNANEKKVTNEITDRLCFAQMNVLELNKAPMNNMDLIFCQNMLIYFRRWRKREIVNRLASRLAVGGMMVLGLGEIVDWEKDGYKRVDFGDTLAFVKNDVKADSGGGN